MAVPPRCAAPVGPSAIPSVKVDAVGIEDTARHSGVPSAVQRAASTPQRSPSYAVPAKVTCPSAPTANPCPVGSLLDGPHRTAVSVPIEAPVADHCSAPPGATNDATSTSSVSFQRRPAATPRDPPASVIAAISSLAPPLGCRTVDTAVPSAVKELQNHCDKLAGAPVVPATVTLPSASMPSPATDSCEPGSKPMTRLQSDCPLDASFHTTAS